MEHWVPYPQRNGHYIMRAIINEKEILRLIVVLYIDGQAYWWDNGGCVVKRLQGVENGNITYRQVWP